MKHEQIIGKHGEQTARSVLHGLGLEMIEKVGTPVRLIHFWHHSHKDLYRVIFGERVAGDHRAMFPDGRSVLIEVKTMKNGKKPAVPAKSKATKPSKKNKPEIMGSRSRRIEATGEIVSSVELKRRVADGTIPDHTVVTNILNERFVVMGGEIIREPA